MDINAHRRARLKELVDLRAGGNVEEFARIHPEAVGATRLRQMLNPNYRNGSGFKEGAARKLEEALKLPSLYFDLGIESALAAEHEKNIPDASISAPNGDLIVKSQEESGNTMGLSKTEPGSGIRGRVPLITWDQARTWDPLMTSFKTQDALTWLACPVEHGPATFCIENNTESMDDGTRRGYGEGDILFIDPSVPVVPDKDILVILPDGKMLLRRLKEDGEGPYLLALNGKRIDRWQDGTVVQGVVIFSGISR